MPSTCALLLYFTAAQAVFAAVDPWLQGSGLLGDTPRLPPATWPVGASFAGVFTDSAVLQQAPQSAALYGVVVSPSGGLDVTTLAVNVTLSRDGLGVVVAAAAQFVDVVNASYAHWKAVLPPQASRKRGRRQKRSVALRSGSATVQIRKRNMQQRASSLRLVGSDSPCESVQFSLHDQKYVDGARVE